MNTNTTRGGAWGGGRSAHGEVRSRRARHPKTTLPHRPPGPLAATGLVGGARRLPGVRPFRGPANAGSAACPPACLRGGRRSAQLYEGPVVHKASSHTSTPRCDGVITTDVFFAKCCTCMSVSMCMCMPMWDEPPGTPHNSNSLSLSGEQGTLRSLSGKISETARCKIDRSGEGLSRPIIAR